MSVSRDDHLGVPLPVKLPRKRWLRIKAEMVLSPKMALPAPMTAIFVGSMLGSFVANSSVGNDAVLFSPTS
jgi:hypothetical protein